MYKRLRFLLNFVTALLSKYKLFGIYPLWDGPPCGALNSLNIIDKCIRKFEAVSRPTMVGLAQGLFLIEYLQLIELSWSDNSRNEQWNCEFFRDFTRRFIKLKYTSILRHLNPKFCALDIYIMGYTKYELSIFTTALHYASEKSFYHCVRKKLAQQNDWKGGKLLYVSEFCRLLDLFLRQHVAADSFCPKSSW